MVGTSSIPSGVDEQKNNHTIAIRWEDLVNIPTQYSTKPGITSMVAAYDIRKTDQGPVTNPLFGLKATKGSNSSYKGSDGVSQSSGLLVPMREFFSEASYYSGQDQSSHAHKIPGIALVTDIASSLSAPLERGSYQYNNLHDVNEKCLLHFGCLVTVSHDEPRGWRVHTVVPLESGVGLTSIDFDSEKQQCLIGAADGSVSLICNETNEESFLWTKRRSVEKRRRSDSDTE